MTLIYGVRSGLVTRKCPPSADDVAAALEGIHTIREANQLFRSARWRISTVGNLIVFNSGVVALLIDGGGERAGYGSARWSVYGIADRPCVRIVVGH